MFPVNKIKKDISLNGWNFDLIIDNKKYNINKSIRNIISSDYILDIDEKIDFKKFIKSNHINYKICYLKISNLINKNWDPTTVKEFTPFRINLKKIIFNKNLNIVYFINSDLNKSFFKLFKDQLKDLIKSKIFEYPQLKLHIVIICSVYSRRENIKNIIKSISLNKYFDYELTFSNDQNKEYIGINKVWELSKKDSEEYILYFHGKGLSYINNPLFYIRQPIEKFIFKLLIKNWKKSLEKISRFESVNKISILSGGNGWGWFNFWIARSSYISNLEKPKKTKYASYYEDWLGRLIINKSKGTKKIYCNEFNERFYDSLEETLSILDAPIKEKYNLGSSCKVEKGGFVGLGLIKYTYKIWYLFYVILNRLGINKGNRERFLFF